MKERESNIELFRIVATFMILIVHCNGWFLREWGDITTWSAGQGWFVGGTRALIQSLSCLGVNCFVLISGFFSIRPKVKSILNLYSIMVFFYILCYALSIFVGEDSFSWKMLCHKFFAFSEGGNWFVQSYLMLMLLSPLLNAFVEKCTEKSLFLYILAYMAIMYYLSAIRPAKHCFFAQGYSFATFICLYLIGRFVYLYGLLRVSQYPRYVLWMAFGADEERCRKVNAVFDYELLQSSSEQQLHHLLFEDNYIPATTLFYHKERMRATGVKNDERIPLLEDWPKWINLLRAGVKFHFIDKVLVRYRVGGVSTSSIASEKMYMAGRLLLYYYQYPAWYKENPELAIKKMVEKDMFLFHLYAKERERVNSHAYRLGKAILKPFNWFKKLVKLYSL